MKFILALAIATSVGCAQRPVMASANTQWKSYGADAGGTRFSNLAQINRNNVSRLKLLWTFHTGDLRGTAENLSNSAFEATPIESRGILYFPTPFSKVIAVDAETGHQVWKFDPKINTHVRYGQPLTARGVALWEGAGGDQICGRRIFFGTADARLLALDAVTGKPCQDFGDHGQIDLKIGVKILEKNSYQLTSPPAIYQNVVIVGSSIRDDRTTAAPSGVVRAFDAVTGKRIWSWDPVPRDRKAINAKTWQGPNALATGAANVWAPISVDIQRGLVFLPTSSPSVDYYGGERIGDNLYSDSVVALRASTGVLVWAFQTVKHDLWDYDVASQPTLVDVNKDGVAVPAVIVATKMGFVYILDRQTGKPIFPIEERSVPKSRLPGEVTAKTQIFPVLPPPLVPLKLSPEDAWGLDQTSRLKCAKLISSLRSEGIFTPPSAGGTVLFPGPNGGMNWSGVSVDPVHQIMFTNWNNVAHVVWIGPPEQLSRLKEAGFEGQKIAHFGKQKGTPYSFARVMLTLHEDEPNFTVPCNAPPWGQLAAIDLVSGKIKWKTPLGFTPELNSVPGHEKFGSVNFGGSMATAGGLVFIAAARDDRFRAFDEDSGSVLWESELPAGGQATPMTFLSKSGRQIVVIAAGGHGRLKTKAGDSVVAYALEENR